MWKRKELKNEAKNDIKKNYWQIIAVCLLMAILCGEYGVSTRAITQYGAFRNINGQKVLQLEAAATAAINRIFSKEKDIKLQIYPTKGVFASILRSLARSEATASNIYRTALRMGQNHSGLAIFIGFMAILISAFYEIFIRSLLRIGERRFFLENHLYHGTKVRRIFFLFKLKKVKGPIWTYLVMNIYLTLWSLTIVGGIIKRYSYKMIPYILAENPDISRKDAFNLSREMMNGNKWNAFLLDFSFIGWNFLVYITLGFLGIFLVNPYIRGTEAHLYLTLRQKAIDQNVNAANQLQDTYLTVIPEGKDGYYYPGLADEQNSQLTANYCKNYKCVNLVLFFFTSAFIGWCWEVVFHIILDGVFVNRGVLFGPWLPIYGTGGVGTLILLKKVINRPVLTFTLIMVFCGIVEYFTSWYLEMFKGVQWWEYNGYLLNLDGRICLEGLLTFAIAGCAFIYIGAPKLDILFNKIPTKVRYFLCVILIVLFTIDIIYSYFNPNMGAGITFYRDLV